MRGAEPCRAGGAADGRASSASPWERSWCLRSAFPGACCWPPSFPFFFFFCLLFSHFFFFFPSPPRRLSEQGAWERRRGRCCHLYLCPHSSAFSHHWGDPPSPRQPAQTHGDFLPFLCLLCKTPSALLSSIPFPSLAGLAPRAAHRILTGCSQDACAPHTCCWGMLCPRAQGSWCLVGLTQRAGH